MGKIVAAQPPYWSCSGRSTAPDNRVNPSPRQSSHPLLAHSHRKRSRVTGPNMRHRGTPRRYQSIPPRDFDLLMKDPDSAEGRKIIVYGVVTQFDAATGTDRFERIPLPSHRNGRTTTTTASTSQPPTQPSSRTWLRRIWSRCMSKWPDRIHTTHSSAGARPSPRFWVYIHQHNGIGTIEPGLQRSGLGAGVPARRKVFRCRGRAHSENHAPFAKTAGSPGVAC